METKLNSCWNNFGLRKTTHTKKTLSATFHSLNYYCIFHTHCILLRQQWADLLPWLCMNASLPGSWWHHRRHKGSFLCVSPPTTPRPPRTTGWGSHPTSRPSTWWPSWQWSQHAAGPAARSSTWWGQVGVGFPSFIALRIIKRTKSKQTNHKAGQRTVRATWLSSNTSILHLIFWRQIEQHNYEFFKTLPNLNSYVILIYTLRPLSPFEWEKRGWIDCWSLVMNDEDQVTHIVKCSSSHSGIRTETGPSHHRWLQLCI